MHSVLKQFFVDRGISIDPPVWDSIRRDIKLSILSTVIFASPIRYQVWISGEDGFDNFTVDIGEPVIAASEAVREFFVIPAE